MAEPTPIGDDGALLAHLATHVLQGDIFEDLPAPHVPPVSSQPDEKLHIGEHSDVDAALFIVLTQVCDIIKPPDREPWIHVARIVQYQQGAERQFWSDISRGTTPTFFPLHGFPRVGEWYADFRTIGPVDKRAFLGQLPVHRIGDASLPAFHKAIQRRLTRPAVENDVVDYLVGPLRNRFKKRKGLAAEIERVLVNHSTEDNEVELCFLVPDELFQPEEELRLSDIQTAIREFLRTLDFKGKFELAPLVYQSAHSMSLEQYEHYQTLDLDFLTPEE